GCAGARDPRAVLALMSAFGTWEEFVPGGEQRLLAVHDEGIFRGCAEEIPKGKLPKDLADTRVDAGGEAGVRGAGVVVESGGAIEQRGDRPGGQAGLLGCAAQQQCPF